MTAFIGAGLLTVMAYQPLHAEPLGNQSQKIPSVFVTVSALGDKNILISGMVRDHIPLERDDERPEDHEHLHTVIRLDSGKISVILNQKQEDTFIIKASPVLPASGLLAYRERQEHPPLIYKKYSHDVPPGQKSKFIVGPYLVTVYPNNAT